MKTLAEKLTRIAERMGDIFNAGISKHRNTFWDAFQENGNRTNYNRAFYNWPGECYEPKHPIQGTMSMAFLSFKGTSTKVALYPSGDIGSIFQGAANLVSIPYLDLTNITTLTSAFTGCAALTNVVFGGTLKQTGLQFTQCPNLTRDSLVSLINCLEDKSSDTSGTSWKINLGSVLKAKLTANDINKVSQKGWSII